MKCDFCNDPAVTHILPARTFVMGYGHGSQGDWACCNNCAALLEKNQWTDLITRAKAAWEHKNGLIMPPAAEQAMRTMYRRLRKNVTGPIRLI